MEDYEAFVRRHLTSCYRAVRGVVESDEEAALVAQAICLHAFQRRAEREARGL